MNKKIEMNTLDVIAIIYILLITFIIGRGNYKIEIYNIVFSYEIFIFIIFFVILLMFIIYLKKIKIVNNKINIIIYSLFFFIIIYSLTTIVINEGLELSELKIPPLLLVYFNITIPFLFSLLISVNKNKAYKFLYLLSLIISSSVFIPFMNTLSNGEDISRLSTSLGGAAVIHVALLISLSIYIINLKLNYHKFFSVIMIIVNLTMIISTQSRAGIITLVLFLMIILIDFKNIKKSLIIGVLLYTLLFTIFQLFPSDRLDNLESQARSETYETSKNIFLSSTKNIIFGTGYGEIWPWYGYENGLKSFNSVIRTTEGNVLTNSHSVFWGVATELGLIGLVPLMIIMIIIIQQLIKAFKNNNIVSQTILLAIVSTIPAFYVDLYLFKNFNITAIWWLFLFYALKLNND